MGKPMPSVPEKKKKPITTPIELAFKRQVKWEREKEQELDWQFDFEKHPEKYED